MSIVPIHLQPRLFQYCAGHGRHTTFGVSLLSFSAPYVIHRSATWMNSVFPGTGRVSVRRGWFSDRSILVSEHLKKPCVFWRLTSRCGEVDLTSRVYTFYEANECVAKKNLIGAACRERRTAVLATHPWLKRYLMFMCSFTCAGGRQADQTTRRHI